MDQPVTTDDGFIENRTFDEIAVGETASTQHTLTRDDIELFAVVSGDVNPAHLDPAYAETDLFHRIIAHGMWGGALISAVLGTRLPGPGTIYLSQDLHFRAPVGIGDTITTTVTAREKEPAKHRIIFDCASTNQDGRVVISGVAEVQAPTEKIRRPRMALPGVQMQRHERFTALIAEAKTLPRLTVAVAHPCDALSLGAVVELALEGLITSISRPIGSRTCPTATPPPPARWRWCVTVRRGC